MAVLKPGHATLALLLAAALHVAGPGVAESRATSTDEVKAAFLYNFVKFVEWTGEPSASSTPLVLAVLGSDSIAAELNRLAGGRTVGGRPLLPRQITAIDDPAQVHLLFIGAAQKDRVAEIMRRVDGASVLTVSDMDRFCEHGGVIELTLENRNMRFDVNLDAAERSRLKVSSKLLNLARTVYPNRVAQGDRR